MAAFDANLHEIDPKTGFQVHKDTGAPVGLIPRPHEPVAPVSDFPKWVPVDESHVVRRTEGDAPVHVSTPAFEDFHVNRVTGEVTVLVHDEEGEKKAKSSNEPVIVEDKAPVVVHPYDGGFIDDENNKIIEVQKEV